MSSKTKYNKICEHCGVKFIAQKMSTKFCSHRCASHAYKQKKREERVAIANNDIKNQGVPPLFRQEISESINPSNNNLSTLKEKEYLSLAEVAQLIGIERTTAYRYCTSGKLKCKKMNRKIFIRRRDIDDLFESAPAYEVTPRVIKEKTTKNISMEVSESSEPITDFLTAQEASIKFGVTKDAIHRRAKTQNIPFVLYWKTR